MPTRLRVSDNRRFLVREDGAPFFYLGDTAWELFHRLTREEADTYLRDRAAKRFSVIQAVALAEYDGLHTPNPYGARPLLEDDPTRPDEPYWQHVDWIVRRANELGMFVGLLPTWGDKWNMRWGIGPLIFTPENAEIYGEWLGRRYRDANVLWILGGDRTPETPEHYAIIRGMARGVRRAVGDTQLISYHPNGQHTSASYFHDDDWLDFNMLQSGHTRDRDNDRSVAEDYARELAKPCMDAEPGYEDHPSGFKQENGYLDETDVRKSAYWALLAGAHGHTYGCHDIWQFYAPGRDPITFVRTPWTKAIHLPGSGQMTYVRALFESRPQLTRVPDQALIASDAAPGPFHIRAARDEAGGYAFVYIPDGRDVTVDLTRLTGETVAASWFDPRSGESREIGSFAAAPARRFTPPSGGRGNDWVLVLDAGA
jgi:hypothetical protein